MRVLFSQGHGAAGHGGRAPGGVEVLLLLLVEERHLLLEVARVEVVGHVKSGVEGTGDAEVAALIRVGAGRLLTGHPNISKRG